MVTEFSGRETVSKKDVVIDMVDTDASMSGFGGTFGSDWFAGFWEGEVTAVPDYHREMAPLYHMGDMTINVRELWILVVSARIWGPS